MEFKLLFEGEIRPRKAADLAGIHAIRQTLHHQLKALWTFPPLDGHQKWLELPTPANPDYAVVEQRGAKTYAPLISKRTDLLCDLEITFLRQQAKGQLISEGGDLDNRLKTLFDALRIPSTQEVAQLGSLTAADADPLHCLLQDDSLVTRVGVETDRLLRPSKGPHDLVLIIKVVVKTAKVTMGNVGLLG